MSGLGVCVKTQNFFESASHDKFVFVLGLYDECIRAKAHSKSQKPENIIKLDKWYQNEFPRKLQARGKDVHLTHEELVQTIKWKLARGKFRPNLTNLVQMNTPRVVVSETKKAFRNLFKRGDLHAALSALCNLKGIGPATASAVLAAGAPGTAPFMADECLLSMPEVESLDYTMKEYLRFVEHINAAVERLNKQAGSEFWTPHKVELAVWSHYVANDLKPELLEKMPTNKEVSSETSNDAENGAEADAENGNEAMNGESEETTNTNSNAEESNAENGSKSDETSKDNVDEASNAENGTKSDENEASKANVDESSNKETTQNQHTVTETDVKDDDKKESVTSHAEKIDSKIDETSKDSDAGNNVVEQSEVDGPEKNGHKEETTNGNSQSETSLLNGKGGENDQSSNGASETSDNHTDPSEDEPAPKKARVESTNEDAHPNSHVEASS